MPAPAPKRGDDDWNVCVSCPVTVEVEPASPQESHFLIWESVFAPDHAVTDQKAANKFQYSPLCGAATGYRATLSDGWMGFKRCHIPGSLEWQQPPLLRMGPPFLSTLPTLPLPSIHVLSAVFAIGATPPFPFPPQQPFLGTNYTHKLLSGARTAGRPSERRRRLAPQNAV